MPEKHVVVGAIGKKYAIFLNEKGNYELYDREFDDYIGEKMIDQERVRLVLRERTEESKEVLRNL